MGQQQLLLIILGVIVVGIAVAVGITMFSDNAVSANRDAVVNDLVNFAARAQQYFRRPRALGGGQGDFTNVNHSHLSNVAAAGPITNANGTYTITSVAPSTIQIQGIGVETSSDGNKVEMLMFVRTGGQADSVAQVH